MKKKYLKFYFTWITIFYFIFSVEDGSLYIIRWDIVSKIHYSLFGIILGILLIVFWYIDDNFKLNI